MQVISPRRARSPNGVQVSPLQGSRKKTGQCLGDGQLLTIREFRNWLKGYFKVRFFHSNLTSGEAHARPTRPARVIR